MGERGPQPKGEYGRKIVQNCRALDEASAELQTQDCGAGRKGQRTQCKSRA